jgi:hypothetical protein
LVVEFKNKRLTTVAPDATIVPIVIEPTENIIIPTLVGAGKVNVPEIVALLVAMLYKPAEGFENVILLKVILPRVALAPEPLKTNVEVPALKVKFVVVAVVHAEVAEENVQVELPRFIVLALLPLPTKFCAVTEKLFVVNVPWLTVSVPVLPQLRASPSCTVLPEAEIVTSLNVLPAEVIVPVLVIDTAALALNVIPETRVMLPATLIAAPTVNVPVKPVQVMDLAPVLVAATVQVPVDRFVKNTSSAEVGTD